MADVCAVLVPRYLEAATDNAETRGFEGNSRCVDERIGINVQSCLTAERTGRGGVPDRRAGCAERRARRGQGGRARDAARRRYRARGADREPRHSHGLHAGDERPARG